ncbi:MAG TPA: epoxyqueuosine reductase [Candidatus Eisenbacteria bacterium]|uniref:Epoxyqueuosine reductase n=1 Tax=Eiseniibacteriota bacterium TaxID=2212470 RepID=A0A7V2AVE5_UNCEI|nr:epoxyqueuosine reductase [Candidatus Eisenbacteria bacterium]
MSESPKSETSCEKLRAAALGAGVDLFGTARIDEGQRSRFHDSIRDIARALPYAVSMGIRLSSPVLETVLTAPTWTYYYHYRQVNTALDQAALFIAGEIQREGYSALPVPASQILDWDLLGAHLSHREIAGLAGLGWMGRNNLLVTPRFGSQVRLVTVLTDMELPARSGGHAGGDCGRCRACVSMCPVGAIGEDPGDFNLDRCAAQLRRFTKSEKINAMICGLCVKVCGGQKDG